MAPSAYMAETKKRNWVAWVLGAAVAIAALMLLTSHRQNAPVVPVATIGRDQALALAFTRRV